jgi:hypothetical protein
VNADQLNALLPFAEQLNGTFSEQLIERYSLLNS